MSQPTKLSLPPEGDMLKEGSMGAHENIENEEEKEGPGGPVLVAASQEGTQAGHVTCEHGRVFSLASHDLDT